MCFCGLYGYDKTLSFKAKYNIGERTVSSGIKELERANILEVTRHIPLDLGEMGDRPANVYRLNRLVSKEEFKEGIERLNKEYGEDTVSKARGFSGKVNEPMDIANIEVFIGLIREYGYNRVYGYSEE